MPGASAPRRAQLPAARIEIATTLEILERFDGLPSLKRLQAHLNLDPENAPISRRGWKTANRDLLAADPAITASVGAETGLFGPEQSFKVVYCRLKTEDLRLTDERAVVAELLPHYPYTLFVFSDGGQKRFHFLNVKDEPTGQKRRLFRRITVGSGERLRTAAEQLGKLDGEELRNLPLSEIQRRFDEAFDVGPVTKKFFEEYKRAFLLVKGSIKGFKGNEEGEEARNLFTQRLFNRLMFIAFIQKKGWLKYQGDADYLKALWRAHQRDTFASKGTFYSDRLQLLFFAAFNRDVNIVGAGRSGAIETLIGTPPYLNGGLFERDAYDDNPKIVVPDDGIDQVINGLFEQFNFTITESTPLDIEVAVDPEMLGKIFEELVTGRHESGSYYTPKPIVSFMCREALKGYLESQVSSESKEAIGRFVDKHEASDLINAEKILDALRRVTVCDPACGSGAYLLGMLHELLDLRQCLFQTKKVDPLSVYERKLDIILCNIHGVDLDAFAVNIARLRLWLSLAVDYAGAVPEPLPNLDYKIERGDSLTAPISVEIGAQGSFVTTAIHEYLKLKREYLDTHGSRKTELRRQVDAKKIDVTSWIWGNVEVKGFDWCVEFAEIFLAKGFDIVLANPPYVRADAQFKHLDPEPRQAAIAGWKKYRQDLIRSDQYETLKEKWDLYIPFLERTFQMLKPCGMMAYIIPDAYNSNKYSEASHELFLREATIRRIDFCSGIDIFDAGVHNTILFFCKQTARGSVPLRVLHPAPDVEQFMTEFQVLPSLSQDEMGQALFRPQERSKLTTFDSVILSRICYISKGMALHAHESKAPNQFKAEDLVSSKQDARHPKQYAEGKDIERWTTKPTKFLEYGTTRSPKKVSRPTFPELYEVSEKLISMDIAADRTVVTLDKSQLFHNHSAWSFVSWHLLKGVTNRSIKKTAVYRNEVTSATMPETTRDELEKISKSFMAEYLVAVMNSNFAQQWLSGERRNKLHLYPDDWKQLPIPVASSDEQRAVARLVVKLCDKISGGATVAEIASIEAKIDSAVNDIINGTSG